MNGELSPALYHCTGGFGLACILSSGSIEPSSAAFNVGYGRPAVWLTVGSGWEQTVEPWEKLLDADWGRWRIQVQPPPGKVLTFPQWKLESREPIERLTSLEKKAGARAHYWRACLEAIPCCQWVAIYALSNLGWLRVSDTNWKELLRRCAARKEGWRINNGTPGA